MICDMAQVGGQSLGSPSAVDGVGSAGDLVGVVGAEEGGKGTDVFGGTETAGGLLVSNQCLAGLSV